LNAERSGQEKVVCMSLCLSVRLSVYPSVRPSVKRVDCDKTEKDMSIFYTIRKII